MLGIPGTLPGAPGNSRAALLEGIKNYGSSVISSLPAIAINYGSIAGQVYLDSNISHTKDNWEATPEGITVQAKLGATVYATTLTDAEGRFAFLGLPKGDYTIQPITTDSYITGQP